MTKNLSQVRQVWKRQSRDANGRFSSLKKFDYSVDKSVVDTLVRAGDKSLNDDDSGLNSGYSIDDLRNAFYEGANGSTFFALSTRFEYFIKKLNNKKYISTIDRR